MRIVLLYRVVKLIAAEPVRLVNHFCDIFNHNLGFRTFLTSLHHLDLIPFEMALVEWVTFFIDKISMFHLVKASWLFQIVFIFQKLIDNIEQRQFVPKSVVLQLGGCVRYLYEILELN